MVAWRHQTVRIDGFIVGRCVAMGTGAALLHSQEGADALDLTLETAVSQRLAFGTQPACSHPLCVLLLLGDERHTAEKEIKKLVRSQDVWEDKDEVVEMT